MKCTKTFKDSISAVVVLFSAFISTQSVIASQVKMSVFEGYESSEAVLEGDYDTAIKLATYGLNVKNSYKRTVEATTLCVAYSKTGKFSAAESACDDAIKNSEQAIRIRAADKVYSDGINNSISLVEVTELNKKALLSLMSDSEFTASLM